MRRWTVGRTSESAQVLPVGFDTPPAHKKTKVPTRLSEPWLSEAPVGFEPTMADLQSGGNIWTPSPLVSLTCFPRGFLWVVMSRFTDTRRALGSRLATRDRFGPQRGVENF